MLTVMLVVSSAWASSATAPVSSDRAWAERERLFRVFHHAGANYWGITFGITLYLFENGPYTNRLGHDNLLANLEAHACPAIPKEDRRIAAGVMAMHKALAGFVLSDPARRREFWTYWSKFYHAGGPARDPAGQEENNRAYARIMEEVWRGRAVPWMKAHGVDQMRTKDIYLFAPLGWAGNTTLWTP
jgi:hypothetical protein